MVLLGFQNGYLYQFDLHTGKKEDSQTEHCLGVGVVLALTESIEGLNCDVYIDNFFKSVHLQEALLEKAILTAGTVRSNQKNLPKAPQVPDDKKMKRGEVACLKSAQLVFTKWMDNKPAFMLSNFLGAFPL